MEGAGHGLAPTASFKAYKLSESQSSNAVASDLTKAHARRTHMTESDSDSEPLIDTTVILPLHSRRLERQQKRQLAKAARKAEKMARASLSRLPAELLLQVLSYLEPDDTFRLRLVDQALRAFVSEHTVSLAKTMIKERYSVLSKCFPTPVKMEKLEESERLALLHPSRQRLIKVSHMAYEHIPVMDVQKFCSCMGCVLAWNNMCLLLDFAYWQKNLNEPRKPIPDVKQGTQPAWNVELLELHAAIAEKATDDLLIYAVILQKHLAAINDAISRYQKHHAKRVMNAEQSMALDRSSEEADSGKDTFLLQKSSPSHEFPYNRAQYEHLIRYVPNRHWRKGDSKWLFYAAEHHARDLLWVKTHYTPVVQAEGAGVGNV